MSSPIQNHVCECSRPATVQRWSKYICERCAKADDAFHKREARRAQAAGFEMAEVFAWAGSGGRAAG